LNWIDRLFGKKEEAPSKITLDELPGWLESKYRKISGDISGNASSIYSDIEKALDEIKESTAFLEDAEPEGRFHLKMVKVASSNRDNMARQVKMLLDNITLPEDADLKTIMDFHENAVQTLTVCLENMMKSYQYTKLVFLEESKNLIADVNALGRLLNQLVEPVNNRKTVLNAFDNARDIMQYIRNTNLEIEVKERAVKEQEGKITLLKKEIEENQKALALLRESEPWKQYLDYRNELILLENNASKKEAEIKGIISPLNKALGRLKQLSDSGRYTLNPESRESLNLCLSEPVKVAPEFFVEFQKIVESGILNLTSEKTNKILEQARLVIPSLDASKKEYHALMQEIEKKKDGLSKLSIASEEKALEDGIAALHEKLSALEKELESSKNHLASLEHNLELKRQELQQSISLIDSRIRLL